ncbi:MAG: DUF362 domain-containing protein [Candidatus Rokubacteria bacterium]|nr:DUF362 domain-containing protein [Candidatus Rokubacteria bacterium]MBI3109006.1 DUF362 domain-containing protein [Candidatus Rokubacteria bacterium]
MTANPSKPCVAVVKSEDVSVGVRRAIEQVEEAEGLRVRGTVLVKPQWDYYSLGWDAGLREPPAGWSEAGGLFQPYTDPRVVTALVRLLLERGAARVVVGDGPLHETPARWFAERTGMDTVVREAGGELAYFDEEPLVEIAVPDARALPKIQLPRVALECDLFVNVPKLKTHPMHGLSAGFSNLYGLLPHEERHRILKQPQFSFAMIDVMKLLREKAVTVVDAVIAMEGDGPRLGNPVRMDVVLAGRDPVAVDTIAAMVAGFDPIEGPLEVIPPARHAGLGVGDPSMIEIRGESVAEVARPLERTAHPWIHPSPNVKTYAGGDSCGARPWIQYTPMPWEIESGKRYALVLGRTPSIPKDLDADEVWVLGDITLKSVKVKKLEARGIRVRVIPGCPPVRLKEYLRLHKWEYPVEKVRCKYECCASMRG